MTLNRIAKSLAATLLVSACGLAAAGGNTTVAVTANIKATCTFSAASTPLAFGTIDPSGSADATASASVLYKCTNGTPATGVSLASGTTSRTMSDTAGHTLAYTLGWTGDTQTGKGFSSGKDLTLAVTGTITATQYQDAIASATGYTENVTLNITP